LLGLNSAPPALDPFSYLAGHSARGLSDEYLKPSLIGSPRPIKSGDSVLFFNFSAGGLRQLVAPFVESDFSEFPRAPLSDLFIATLTEYRRDWRLPVAFPPDSDIESLSQILSARGLVQIKIGETLKYNSLTYFFNGLREKPFKNEYRVLIPSANNPRPNENPALRSAEITTRVLASLSENVFDFIVVNYAGADVIGHTGDLSAAATAARAA